VLPSYREGTPRTLLEAASIGIPLIATDVPGCREVVTHEKNGYLCNVRDAASLANIMERMLDLDDEHLKLMGIQSRQIAVSKFDQNIVFNKYLNAIAAIGSLTNMK